MIRVLIATLLVLCACTSFAQRAPRIGLVLSGGGARGLAHVGVLKVLEEMRVPVSCVTGTSMGAIVGGAYAAGTPPTELETFVRQADWNEVFRDSPPRTEISTRRKIDEYKTLFAPEYGVKRNGLVLPKGVIAGVSIEGFFRRLTAPAIDVTDFSKLPIPFRAVAADIETGEAVVLSHGSLARALRASMSVPGALSPVEIDGRLLVDGGIANNLPIAEARKLCGEVIIAVNISTPPLKREQISSALSVGGQLINFLGKVNVERQINSLGARDVLIAPDLGDISAASFERSADAIRIGEEATRALAEQLARYSVPPEQYAQLRRRQTAERKPLGAVDEIRFEGLERTNPAVVSALVSSKPGQILTEEQVSADLRRIYGRGDFESIDYQIRPEADRRVLVIHPQEKEWGPDYFRFGLSIATDFQGGNVFDLLAQYRRTWLNRLGGEWLSEAQIGNNSFAYTEFMQPVEERGRYFVVPSARVGQDLKPVFSDGNRVGQYETKESRLGLEGGAFLGTVGEVRLGGVWRDVNANTVTGPTVLPEAKEIVAGPRAALYIDQLDNAWFPRGGYRLSATAFGARESFGSEHQYERIAGEALFASSFHVHTVSVKLAGGSDLNSRMPAFENFTLGGPLYLSGYRIGEFSGDRYAFGRLMYYNRAIQLPDILGSGVFAGASLEVGQMQARVTGQGSPGTVSSASIFLAASTFAGPAYFGFGVGENGHYSVYLLLGAP